MRTYGEAIEVRTTEPVVDPSRSAGGTAASSASSLSSGSSSPALSSLPSPPAQFLWRGRLYLVREVLAHWVELGTWWTARAPRTSSSVTAVAAATGSPVSSPVAAGTSDETEAPTAGRSVAADVGAVEREVWRVEAASGRTARVGVYDLVRDVPAARGPEVPGSSSTSSASSAAPPGRWRLARALD